MFNKTLLLASIGLTCIAAAPSLASSFNPAQFIGIDRNADNKISPDEAVAFRLRYLAALDQNGNGTVEFEEYVQANKLRSAVSEQDAPVPVTEEYKEADANKDTILTHQEILAVGRARFNLLDTNEDGFISQDEFKAPGL